MNIKLYIGEGWTPFMLEANESVAWRLTNIDRLDVAASIESLAEVFEMRVREIYSDAGVEVLDMHYPLIHECNTRPLHFIHGFPD